MPLLACPAPEVLQQFLLGILPREGSEELEEHFASCSSCEATARKLAEFESSSREAPLMDDSSNDPWCDALAAPLHGARELDALVSVSTWTGREPVISWNLQHEMAAQTSFGPGSVIRGYEIQELLGKGGMGIVYRAVQTALKRPVALKMILGGSLVGAERLARFRQEAEVLARIRHPHIVQIFEIGEHDQVLYFSMELAEGGSLADLIKKGPLPVRRAVELMVAVARGVDAAHELGVVHRDLKPGNILLTADGIPKVTDFGLAKQLGEAGGHTQTGDIIGSPTYMSPEQAMGTHDEIGRSTDVYGLGVILYELSTGLPPFQGSVEKVLRQVIRDEPSSPRTVVPSLPQDLETIILKCLQKEQSRRFQTSAELADELSRWLRGEPILSRPVGRLERLTRWSRRNPMVASLIAAVALALMIGTIVSTVFGISALRSASKANENAQLAQANEHAANLSAEEARRERDRADKQARVATEQENLARRRESDARWNSYVLGMNTAFEAWETAATERAHEVLEQFIPQAGESDLRGPEWYLLWSQLRGDEFALRGHRRTVNSVDWSPDGKTIASASDDRSVILWDVEHRTIRKKLTDHSRAAKAVVFSPRGDFLATGASDGTVRIYDGRTWAPRQVLPVGPTKEIKLACSPDGRYLAAAMQEETGGVQVWETATWQLWSRPNAVSSRSVVFSPDSELLATTDDGASVSLFDVASNFRLGQFSGFHLSAQFSPDGSRLITNSGTQTNDQKLLIRSWYGPQTTRIGGKERAAIQHLAISPDRKWLALSEGGVESYGALQLWDLHEERDLCVLEGHHGNVMASAFSPDNRRLASCGSDGTVRVWDVDAKINRNKQQIHTSEMTRARWSADGRWIATAGKDRRLILWDARTRQPLHVLRFEQPVVDLAFSPDNRRLAFAIANLREDGLGLFDLETRQVQRVPLSPGFVTCVAWIQDGSQVAAGGGAATGTVHIVDGITGRVQELLEFPGGGVTTLQFWNNGQWLATGNRDHSISLYETKTRKHVHRLQGHSDTITCITFSQKRPMFVSGSLDGTIQCWNIVGGEREGGSTLSPRPAYLAVHGIAFDETEENLIVGFRTHDRGAIVRIKTSDHVVTERWNIDGRLTQFSSSPNGRSLLLGLSDSRVLEWDIATHRVTGQLGDRPVCQAVALSPDDRHLAVARGQRLDLLDLKSGELRSGNHDETFRSPDLPFSKLLFSPDGRWLVGSAGELRFPPSEGIIRVWDAATGKPEASLATDKRCLVMAFSPDSRQLAAATGAHRTGASSWVDLWDVPAWKKSNRLSGTDSHAGLGTIDFLGDGKQLILGTGAYFNQLPGELILWDIPSAQRIYRFPAHSQPIHSTLLLPHDRLLTAGDDLSLRLWDVKAGRLLRTVQVRSNPLTLAPLPANRVAVGGADGRIHLREMSTWAELASWKAHSGSVSGLAASRDGRLMVSISDQESDTTEPQRMWKFAQPAEVQRVIDGEHAALQDEAIRKQGVADQIAITLKNVEEARDRGDIDLPTYHLVARVVREDETNRGEFDEDCLALIRSCNNGNLPWAVLKDRLAALDPPAVRTARTVRRQLAERDAALLAIQNHHVVGAARKGLVDSLGIEFIELPPGRFIMGSDLGEVGRRPDENLHPVQLTRKCLLASREITRRQFREFVTKTNYVTEAEKRLVKPPRALFDWNQPGFEQIDNHPVVFVSWNDAVAFCEWLSKKEGQRYRLPTEAEFEYACRSGTLPSTGFDSPETVQWRANVRDYSSVKSLKQKTAFGFDDGAAYTARVGNYQTNPWGFYDLIGNVREWCGDRAGSYSPLFLRDPTGPAIGAHRIVRGGSFRSNQDMCRVAARDQAAPESSADDLGFRVVREAE